MSQEKAHNPGSAQEKRPLSKGERAFDFTVYGLMNWVGTFIITVPIAWWMMQGSGKSAFNKLANWFEGQMPRVLRFTDKIMLREACSEERMAERAKWWADKNAITFATFQGGNVMLLPIWLAERAKVPIVKAANEAMGDKTDPATIEAAAPTDGWSLIKARLAAWGTVLVTFTGLGALIPKTFGMFEREFGEKTAKLMGGRAYKPEMPTDLLPKRAQLEEIGAAAKHELKALNEVIEPFETKRFQLGKIASWDTVATTAAVVLLYVGSKFFVQEREKKQASEQGVKLKDTSAHTQPLRSEETPHVESARKDTPSTQVSNVKERAPLAQAALGVHQ